jgi:membrane protein required for colicin V production
MQTYDWIMLAVVAAAVLFGAWKGLAWQVASLAAIFVSYFLALKFRQPVSKLIQLQEPLNQFAAMFILYAVASLGIWIGFGFVRSFIERCRLREFDRQAGALLGAVKGALLCLIITIFAVTLLGEQRRKTICQSRSGLLIARSANQLRVVMPKEIHPLLAPYLNKLDEVMTQENPNYSRQPGLSDVEQDRQGSTSEDAVRQYIGQILTTDQPAAGNEFRGMIEEFGKTSPVAGWFLGEESNQTPADPPLRFGGGSELLQKLTNGW